MDREEGKAGDLEAMSRRHARGSCSCCFAARRLLGVCQAGLALDLLPPTRASALVHR